MNQTNSDSLLLRIALLIFGLTISLIMFEITLRVYEKTRPKVTWSDRPKNWYIPESSIDNRDFYHAPEKADDTFRIIVIGDSFTFGDWLQFDDTLSKRLERMLNLNEKQKKIEVLNWGVPGFSTFQEAEFFKRGVQYFHPDLFILQITLNDPELVPFRATHKNHAANNDILLESKIYKYFHSFAFVAKRLMATSFEKEYDKYYFDLFSNEKTWGRFSNALQDISQTSANSKVPVLAVVYPLLNHTIDDKYRYAPLHQKLGKRLEEVSIPYVDLTENYKNIPADRLQVIPGVDSHPNEIANRIAAEATYLELSKRHLIPEDAIIKRLQEKVRKVYNHVPSRKDASK